MFEERARDGGGEVEVEGVVERLGGVGDDPVDVGLSGLDEVDGGDVADGFAVLVDEEVEGDSVFAEILDVDERGEDVLAVLVVDQDLVDFLVRCGAALFQWLVQIQHPDYTFCTKTQIVSRDRVTNDRRN